MGEGALTVDGTSAVADTTRARQAARELLHQHGISDDDLPVDVLGLARKDVILIASEDLQLASGLYIPNHAPPVIAYNPRDGTKERQRFTVAHELGHHHLSHENVEGVDGILPPDHPLEQEANAFAVELLVPEVWVCEKWVTLCSRNGAGHVAQQQIEGLREKFGVSQLMFYRRLLELELERIPFGVKDKVNQYLSIEAATDVAESMLRQYRQDRPPVDVKAIADAEGLALRTDCRGPKQRFAVAANLGESMNLNGKAFAAALLMPAPWLRKRWSRYPRDVGRLCHEFGVSEKALKVRLERLDLYMR